MPDSTHDFSAFGIRKFKHKVIKVYTVKLFALKIPCLSWADC